jgi:CSLREA domain-containing protein
MSAWTGFWTRMLLVDAMLVPALARAATFTVDSAADGGDSNLFDGVCNDGSGNCTLRAAIQQADWNGGADTINFHIGTGVKTISPGSPLPTVSGAVTIDGTTQPVVVGQVLLPCSTLLGHPCVELDGAGAGTSANGLHITAGNSTVRETRCALVLTFRDNALSHLDPFA